MPCAENVTDIASLLYTLQEQLEGGTFDELSVLEQGKGGSRERFYQMFNSDLATLEPDELVKIILDCPLLIIGDYHPLSESKQVLLFFFQKALEKGIAPLLALDCLKIGKKPGIPGDAVEFLEKRGEGWPFSLAPWVDIVEEAGRVGLPIAGIRGPRDRELDDEHRYRLWSRRIKKLSKNHNGPVWVVLGEIHAAPGNLPSRIKAFPLLLSPPRLYWRLLDSVSDPCDTGVSLDGGKALAVIPVHPLRRPNSYLAWQDEETELFQPPARKWVPRPVRGRDRNRFVSISQALAVVAPYFGVNASILGKPLVLLPRDLSRINGMLESLAPQEAGELLFHMGHNQSYFNARKGFIYLARLTLSHVGEELAHAVHVQLSPLPERALDSYSAFYHHVIREAFAFAGSKALNPARRCPTVEELREMTCEDNGAGRAAGAVLAHLDMERRGPVPGLPWPPEPREINDPEIVNFLAHALGYMLGESIWKARTTGAMQAGKFFELSARDLARPGEAPKLYEELIVVKAG